MKKFLSFLAKVFSILIKIGLILFVGIFAFLLRQGAQPLVGVAPEATTATEAEVNIPISKTQIMTEGQPLKRNQFIQLSVYIPKADGKGLAEKVNLYAKVVNQNENFVILSVPISQATALEEAMITENAKLVYHEIDKKPELPEASPTPVTTTIPEPAANAVQLMVPVEEVQGGIASLTPNMTVKLVIIERLAVYHVEREPVATFEPTAPVETCATVLGFMIEDNNGLISNADETPAYILLEIPVANAPEMTRALTNASAVYLLPIIRCN